MKSFVSFLIPLLLIPLLFSCKTHMQRADEAFIQNNWDGAVKYYSKALNNASNPSEVCKIKDRLQKSSKKAAQEHFEKAKQFFEIGDTANAMHHTSLAFEYDPTPKIKDLYNGIREKEGRRLLDEGKIAFQSQKFEEAIALLTKAHEVYPSQEGQQLLVTVKQEFKKFEETKFTELLKSSRKNLEDRNWYKAGTEYEAAFKYGTSAQSQKEYEFCKLMFQAKINAENAFNNPYAH